MEVSSDNSFHTEFTDERSASNHPQDFGDAIEESSDVQESVREKLEFADIGDPLDIEEETADGVDAEAFAGITVGKAFHHEDSSLNTSCIVNWQNSGKINKDVQVKIPELKMGAKLSLHVKENLRCSQCSQCLKKFSDKSRLRRHIKKVHNKEQPYQCTQCSRKFSEGVNLTRHIQTVHKKEKPHACLQPGCSQKFGLKGDLKRHMMKVHNFEKPHLCVEQNCDEKFVRHSDLKDHLRSAHGAAKLVCGVQNCAATFTFGCSLRYHKRKQHADK